MRIIISDSSCLIDLRKADLLAVFLRLPFEIMIPNTLFEDELLSFTDLEKQELLGGGLKVVDLPGAQVSRARDVIRAKPRLSIHDGFAYVLAESHPGCVLLTGDSQLRALADESQMEVHGILWVFDELLKNQLSTANSLHAILSQFAVDPAVRLPKKDLTAYLKRYEGIR
jgi:hypothetical protein